MGAQQQPPLLHCVQHDRPLAATGHSEQANSHPPGLPLPWPNEIMVRISQQGRTALIPIFSTDWATGVARK